MFDSLFAAVLHFLKMFIRGLVGIAFPTLPKHVLGLQQSFAVRRLPATSEASATSLSGAVLERLWFKLM